MLSKMIGSTHINMLGKVLIAEPCSVANSYDYIVSQPQNKRLADLFVTRIPAVLQPTDELIMTSFDVTAYFGGIAATPLCVCHISPNHTG